MPPSIAGILDEWSFSHNEARKASAFPEARIGTGTDTDTETNQVSQHFAQTSEREQCLGCLAGFP